VVLVDDGFQDPSFARTLSLVVVDAKQGFGNGLCLPAGPLREPVAAGLARADAMIVIGDDPMQPDLQRTITEFANPVLRAALHPVETGMDWTQGCYLAFAGIGQPEKFYKTLAALGANIVETVNLDDHQPLTPALIKRLAHQAHSLGQI
jgi:tetraacyldisaccharide 4'-kinase